VICAEIFIWLRHQKLDWPEIFGATFGIGGGELPPLTHQATRLCLVQVIFSIVARYHWCLWPKLHICAAGCSDSQMELIVSLEESILRGCPKTE